VSDVASRSPESPPPGGLSGVPSTLGLLRSKTLETLDRANLPLLASALTFDLILAVIPLAFLLIAGLGYFLSSKYGTTAPADLIARFLPPHPHCPASTPCSVGDPFSLVEHLVTEIQGYRSRLTWFALPLSLWFSTRVFAAMRICLSQIYSVRERPVRGHFVWSYIAGYLVAKARDVVIVVVVLVLALTNTVMTSGMKMLTARGVTVDPRMAFLVTAGGRLAGQLVAFLFGIILFVVLYRYSSPKRLAWASALIASVVGTLGFELAKRLYGLYLTYASHGQFSFDADVGAVLLFVLWLWYMSLVFLIGAAVADVWDHIRRIRALELAGSSA
jgi:uncharacterized BrkB/YihY/UPF0761 family membrane protein